VLLGANEDRSELARLVTDGFPFVFAGRREINGEPSAYVGAGYAAVAAEMIDHLAAFGHRNILYFTDPANQSESAADRQSGIMHGMIRNGIDRPEKHVRQVLLASVSPEAVASWLAGGVTAFVTQSLTLAQTIMAAARALALHPPDSFSIAALGNSNERVDDDGTVTSIEIPQREMGSGSVRMLVDLLERPDELTNRQIILPCQLRPGITTGPVPTTIPIPLA